MTRHPTPGPAHTDADLRALIAAERADLVEVLAQLPDPSWDAPTLCAGWRVREVVAHVTMPLTYSTGRFIVEMARSRGRFHQMADRCAHRDGAAPAEDLVAALRANIDNPWKPPGGGFVGALTHDVIHGLDITVPLGLDRRVPEPRLRVVLDAVTGAQSRKHFGVDLSGIRLHATDLDWGLGTGAPVYGAAQDLALLLCGRKVPSGHLTGPTAQFTA